PSAGGAEVGFLAGWGFRDGEGELWVASAGGPARQVAKAARAFAWSPRGELAFVGRDLLGFGERTVALSGVQGVAWSPDGSRIAARASAAAGGTLWAVDPQSGSAKEMAIAISDFAFAPDGALAA